MAVSALVGRLYASLDWAPRALSGPWLSLPQIGIAYFCLYRLTVLWEEGISER